MAKDEINRATRAEAGDVVGAPKQHEVAELLKKMKVVAEADAKAAVESSHDEQAAAPAQAVQADAQMVASADSIFASDAAPIEVAMLEGGSTGSGGGVSTGTLLAIGGVALVGGGIAIAANNDSGGNDTPAPVTPTVTTVAPSGTSVNEGQAVTFTVTGTPGATFSWSVDAAHVNDVAVSTGSVVLGADGKGTITITTTADHLTEGAETFKVTVGGVDSAAVTINDTSVTPPIEFTLNQNEVLNGTAGDDVFNAPLLVTGFGFQSESFQNGDKANGGAGNDTLNVSVLQSDVGARVLDVDTTSVENVNVELINNYVGPVGVHDYINLAGDVTNLSVTGDNPVAINELAVIAQGLTDVSLHNVNSLYLYNATEDEMTVSIVNDRPGVLSGANYTYLYIGSDPTDYAAYTLNLTVDTGNLGAGGPAVVASAYTDTLNLTVAGAGSFVDGTQDNVVFSTAGALRDVVIDGTGDLYLDITSEAISSFDASALNGGVAAYLYSNFDPVAGEFTLSVVKGGKGDDYLYVDYLADAGASVDLGTGNDYLYVEAAMGNTTIAAGDGNDYVGVDYAYGTMAITGGAGDDYVYVYNAYDTLSIDTGAGDDVTGLYNFTSGKQVTITTGDGNDFVDVSNAAYSGAATNLLVNISLGAGDDVLDARIGTNLLTLLEAANYNGTTHVFTPHVTADGGAGVDTLMINASDAADISANDVEGAGLPDGVFNASVSGFEKLDVGALGSYTLDMDTLDGIDYVILQDALFATIDNIDSNGTIEFKDDDADYDVLFPSNLTVLVRDATVVTHTSDVLNIVTSAAIYAPGSNYANNGYLYADGVETFHITTSDLYQADGAGYFWLAINDSAGKTITVDGDGGLYLANENETGIPVPTVNQTVTLFDASGVTAGDVHFLSTNSAAAVTIKGGAGDDYLGSTGTGTFADTISGGAGNDTLVANRGFDQLTGGSGSDTFVIAGNANGNTYASITDFKVSDEDSIDFVNVLFNPGDTAVNFHAGKITLGANAAFADYLNAAASVDQNGADGVAEVSWFTYNGNTYVVIDNNPGASPFDTFQNNALTGDQVVELKGIVDLSSYTDLGTAIVA